MSFTDNSLEIIEKHIGVNVKKTAPQVSIIIPVYNVSRFIAETLDSVKAQTFNDYEIILVNDGSTDTAELEEVLKPYLDDIIYIKQQNSGAAEARNSAIRSARGEILAFLDGDDIWFPSYLESQIDFLKTNELEMVYCDAMLFGESVNNTKTFMKGAPSNGKVTVKSLLTAECNVITSGTLCLKRLIDEHGFFDKTFHGAEDFDLWFRMAKNNTTISYQKKVLLKYRTREGSLSGNSINIVQRALETLELINEKYELNEFEKEILHNQLGKIRAALHLERGKGFLMEEKFDEAINSFNQANKYYRKPKLTVINLLLAVYPKLVFKIFQRFS